MDLVALTEYIVKRIAKNTDAVSVTESLDNDVIILEILASEEDMPRLIGKDGKMINAIRTIVQASGYINEKHNIRVNINAKN